MKLSPRLIQVEKLELLDVIVPQLSKFNNTISESMYGACDNCENLSNDVKLENNRWLCEECRDETAG